MKQFYADAVFATGRGLEGFAKMFKGTEAHGFILGAANRKKLRKAVVKTRKDCAGFELPASIQSCDDLLEVLKSDVTLGEVQSLILELGKRIQVELRAHVYLYLLKDTAAYYLNPLDQWGDSITAFPSIRYDVEEAGKCLALKRNTACVFHLMRVLGAGIKALGKSLNEPTLDASCNVTWDNVLRRCAKEGEKEFAKMSPVWQSDKQFYSEATSKLYSTKDAWRNPNAHEVGQKYTDEEALDIYRAVRSLMRQLSTKLKE